MHVDDCAFKAMAHPGPSWSDGPLETAGRRCLDGAWPTPSTSNVDFNLAIAATMTKMPAHLERLNLFKWMRGF